MPRITRLLGVVTLGALMHVSVAAAADGPEDTDALAGNQAAGQAASDSSGRSLLPVPAALRPQIEFWKKIFTTYSTRQVVIHDAVHLDRIYEVLDFEPLADDGFSDADIAAYKHDNVASEKERLRGMLIRFHQLGSDPADLSPEERKIWALFGDVKDPSEFLEAAADDRIRSQAGLRERFAGGVEVSRRYLPEMEAIFRRAGLPLELTRLPLVESCFNVHAYSKVGAAGIWQFMPSTGRLYMRVNRAVDERRDPIISTKAAGELLQANYDLLGSWPLAITAYNHGRAGVAHAVATVGSSELMQIIREYHGRAFKFASRNFYAEFLAAVEVERNFEQYFGHLYPARPVRTENVVVPNYVGLKTVARASNVEVETLADLNPALTREVVSGRLQVPKGYTLRLPSGSAATFKARYAGLSADEKPRVQRASYRVHRVQRGQTLVTIAKQYGTTVEAIRRSNNLRAAKVRTGQKIVIPNGRSA